MLNDADTLKRIKNLLKELIDFYPMHIEKEDKGFFHPAMGYFTEQELDNMLEEFWEFDRKMIHEEYQIIVNRFEKVQYQQAKWVCLICGYIYDPQSGDSDNGILSITSFEELPDKWRCPVCGASKNDFKRLDTN